MILTALRFVIGLIFPSLLKWWEGRQQAAALQRQTDRAITAEAKVDQANEIIHAEETRHAVDESVGKLPETPPQRVGDARDGSAADQLRQHWQRKDGGQ